MGPSAVKAGKPAKLPLPRTKAEIAALYGLENEKKPPPLYEVAITRYSNEGKPVVHVALPEKEDEDDEPEPQKAPPKVLRGGRKPKKSKTRTTSVKRTQEMSTKHTQNTQGSVNQKVHE
ncbi:hypothetical protein PMAYCL1PPCAC_08773, partial [Pristionchus mayeri]